jgi:5'-3' exoribonuclease 1
MNLLGARIKDANAAMGIPLFLRHLLQRYRTAVTHINAGQLPVTIDHAYIDANGLFYRAVGQIYNNGGNIAELRAQHFAAIVDEMDFLFDVCRPAVSFTIAVDGPAPRAKMFQQRKRRFVAAASPSSSFDTTQISPGTDFMVALDDYLQKYIAARVANRWRHVAVLYSSHLEPGEAEHKLLDIIRAHARSPVGQQQSQCIIGLDADLVMLSLASRHPRMYLLREDQDATKKKAQHLAKRTYSNDPKSLVHQQQFWFVDIAALRQRVCLDLSQQPRRCNIDRVVDDYIVLCFFIGNDFLPKLQAVNNLMVNGLEVLLAIYRENIGAYSTNYLTTARRTISPAKLARFLECLAQHESVLLADRALRRNERSPFPDQLVQKFLDTKTETFDLHGYRDAYNQQRLHTDTHQALCRNYIDGLHWTAAYYFTGCISWTWYYAGHFAPLLADLTTAAGKRRQPQFLLGQPPAPILQLLCVLPPQSAYLLPAPFQTIFEEREDLYPHSVEIEHDGCLFEWEGVALLPALDVKVVEQFYHKTLRAHGADAFPYNVVHKAFLFHNVDLPIE